jgi:hypothetical protein
MSQYPTVLSSDDMINFIISLERVGCTPFKYVDKSIITKFNSFNLETITLNKLDLSDVTGYSSNVDRRVKRKTTNDIEYKKYINIYNCVDFPPIVVDDNYRLIDGFHRVAYYRDHGILELECYKGEL